MKLSYLALCLALAGFGAGAAHAEIQSPKSTAKQMEQQKGAEAPKQAEDPTQMMKRKQSPTVKKKMDGGAETVKKAQGAETEEMQTPKRLR